MKRFFCLFISFLMSVLFIVSVSAQDNQTTFQLQVPERQSIQLFINGQGKVEIYQGSDRLIPDENHKIYPKRQEAIVLYLIPEEGYYAQSVLLNEDDLTNLISENTITTPLITRDGTITVTFIPDENIENSNSQNREDTKSPSTGTSIDTTIAVCILSISAIILLIIRSNNSSDET